MNIILKISGTMLKLAAIVTAVFMVSVGPALSGGTSGLLGVQPGFPQLDSTGGPGQGCSYDSGTMTLTVTSTPGLYFSDANSLDFVTAGVLTVTTVLDLAGNVQSGTFVVNGTTAIGGLTDPLLTGIVDSIGLSDTSAPAGGTDQGDYRISPTGGSILGDPNWPAGADIGATLTMEGSDYSGSLASDWSCARAKLIVGPIDGGGVIKDPFSCYAVNKVSTTNKSGTNKDKVKVYKAGIRLDLPEMVDMTTDMTQVRIDDLTIDIPGGAFDDKGNGKWEYQTASGVIPKIKMKIDFNKATWEFDCTGCDASLIDTSDGIDVCLMINGYESCENVPAGGMSSGGMGHSSGHSSGGKGGSNKSCKLASDGGSNTSDSGTPGAGKLSCLASMTVEHAMSGVQIEKTRVDGTLLHPETVFTDPLVSPDSATFHTSCSKCLQCGDLDSTGKFFIKELVGIPGDKMAQKCGVPDASCGM